MLDDQVLSRITGTLVRGTERIATKDVLTILGIEQRETKRGRDDERRERQTADASSASW